MKHDSGDHSRRRFLKILGTTTAVPLFQNPLSILIQSIIAGAAQSAQAEELGIIPRRYLHIVLDGAPPRWTFDSFLTPYQNNYVANAQVGTRFSADGNSVIYQTVLRKGLNVPWLWQFNVPKAGGGTRPMDQLLDNMLSIRGIDVANPSHGAALAAQFRPLGATQSMPALSADPSTDPISAVNVGVDGYSFKSKASKSPIKLPATGQLLDLLMQPFVVTSSSDFTAKRKALATTLDASIEAIAIAEAALHPYHRSIATATESASDLLSKGFGNLTTIWNGLRNKYIDLVKRSLSTDQNLPGINDKAIISKANKQYAVNADIINSGTDIRSLISTNTQCNRMAEQFAIAEYILTQKLSSSVALSPNGLSAVNVNGGSTGFGFDEHDYGTFTSLMGNSYFNLAYASCLIELIDQLKLKNIFKDTVIVCGSDFGRSPQSTGDGSNHGYSGGTSTIYSGALAVEPEVIGNIYLNKKQDQLDSGTWGYGAPTVGASPITMGNWASSIATLLRVPSPVTASSTLLMTEGDLVKPLPAYGGKKAQQV